MLLASCATLTFHAMCDFFTNPSHFNLDPTPPIPLSIQKSLIAYSVFGAGACQFNILDNSEKLYPYIFS